MTMTVVVAPREVSLSDTRKQLQQLQTDSQDECPNDESVSTELSLDLLSKNSNDNDGDGSLGDSLGNVVNDDAINHRSASSGLGSSGSCRWNPDDSDYSLNVLLPPSTSDGGNEDEDGGADNATTASKDSLFGSDYSLNKLRSRAKKPGKALMHSMSSSSTHSNISMLSMSSSSLDAFEGDGSCNSFAVPEDIIAEQQKKQPKSILISGKVKCSDGGDSNSSRRDTRKVNFYPRVKIQRITPRKKLARETIQAVWYSRNEFTEIRQECFDTIRLMSDDDEIYQGRADEIDPLYDGDDNELCRRGLEYKTPRAYKHRQKQKRDIRTVVFEEQDFQEESGMNDPEWLAKLSIDQSQSCVVAAIATAAEDERQARIFLHGHE